MKLLKLTNYLLIVLFTLSCQEECCKTEYKYLAKGDQIPYLISKYGFKGNVVSATQTEFNSEEGSDKLKQFGTYYYKFKNGFLESYTEEKLNSGRYWKMTTTSTWDANNFNPILYTYNRTNQKEYQDSLAYDSAARMSTAFSMFGVLHLEYDDQNLLTKKEFKNNKQTQWSVNYDYDGKKLKTREFYSHKNDTPTLLMITKYTDEKEVVFDVKNGKEEEQSRKSLNQYGDPLVSTNKYRTAPETSYVYDKYGNWIIRTNPTTYGTTYITRRIITYDDDVTTGKDWTAEKIAKENNISFDKMAYEAYLKKLEDGKPKN